MQKLVIFDLDGTLIDSLPDIYEQVSLTLKEFNQPLHSFDEVRAFTGHGARQLIQNSFTSTDEEVVEKGLKYYNEHYTNCGSPNTRVFSGVEQLILALKERGYKVAILTNKPQMTTDEVYKKYLSHLNFDMVLGQSEKVKCKPDKSATLLIMKTLGASEESTCFVGDDITDVLTAINAGVKGISALWGYREKEFLVNAGATRFALTPMDVLSFID